MPTVSRPESDKALTDPVDPLCQKLIADFVKWIEEDVSKVARYVANQLSLPTESQEVREVVQDALYRTYTAIRRGDFEDRGPGSFTAYVRTAARNVMVDEYRHDDRYVLVDDIDEQSGGEADPTADFEHRDFVRHLLHRLKPRRREVLESHFFDDQSYVEIAAALAISEDVARQETSRGLREARQHC